MTTRFQRFYVCFFSSWGVAPGCYNFAPLALKNLQPQNFPASINAPIAMKATAATRLIHVIGR